MAKKDRRSVDLETPHFPRILQPYPGRASVVLALHPLAPTESGCHLMHLCYDIFRLFENYDSRTRDIPSV